MSYKMPNTPFSTCLLGSAKETELRLRNIFQWKKKRPPVVVFAAAFFIIAGCGNFVRLTPQPSDEVMQKLPQVGTQTESLSEIKMAELAVKENEALDVVKLMGSITEKDFTMENVADVEENLWFSDEKAAIRKFVQLINAAAEHEIDDQYAADIGCFEVRKGANCWMDAYLESRNLYFQIHVTPSLENIVGVSISKNGQQDIAFFEDTELYQFIAKYSAPYHSSLDELIDSGKYESKWQEGTTAILTESAVLTNCYILRLTEGSFREWVWLDEEQILNSHDIVVVLEETDDVYKVAAPHGADTWIRGEVSSTQCSISTNMPDIENGNQANLTRCVCYDAIDGNEIITSATSGVRIGVEIKEYEGDWALVQEIGMDIDPYWIHAGDLSFDFDMVMMVLE